MDNALTFKAKLAIGSAVVSAFVGYGRRAYATASACDLISSTYICSGQTTSPQSFGPGDTNVITTNGFGVNTSTGDAIYFNGTGSFTFTDDFSSVIKATGADFHGIYGSSTSGAITVTTGTGSAVSSLGGNGIVGFTDTGGGAITITTGVQSSVSGADGILAQSNASSSSSTITVTTGANSSVSGANIGIITQGNFDSSITISRGSSVSGATVGVVGESYSGTVIITNNGTIKNTSDSSADNAMSTFVTGYDPTAGSSNSVITNTRTGLITGTVSLNNVVTNSLTNRGTWNTTGGTNNFYANATNIITNTAEGIILAANSTFNDITSFYNAGVMSMQDGVVGNTITVNGDFIGQNGSVKMDAVLGSDGSSDLFLVNGTVSGSTQLFINNTGGNGQLTSGEGILVAEENLIAPPTFGPSDPAPLSNPNTFTLGNRVATGAYDYQLFYDGSNSLDQKWFLRNTLASGAPNYRVEVPLDEVLPSLAGQFGMAMLDTLDDRVGSYIPIQEGRKRPRAWLRLIGQLGNRNNGHSFADFSQRGSSYNWSMDGVQAGYDVINKTHAGRATDVIGADFAVGHMSSNVEQAYSAANAGHINMTGYTFGGYWTHNTPSGWYSDTVIQGTAYDNIKAQSSQGAVLATAGQGYLASLELGRKFNYLPNLSLTPEAQLIYQRAGINQAADSFGLISFSSPNEIYGRIGARLTKNWNLSDTKSALSTWTRLNLWHAFLDHSNTTFSSLSGLNPVTLPCQWGYSWAQISIGASGQNHSGLVLFTSGDVSINFAGGNGQVWAGRLGAKYAF